MRLRLMWCVAMLAALALCPALIAGGEHFPRSTFGYVEIKGGPEFRRFFDITKIAEMMDSTRSMAPHAPEEDGDDTAPGGQAQESPSKKLKRIADAAMPLIDTVEFALLDIMPQERELPVKFVALLTLTETKGIEWFKALDPAVGQMVGMFNNDTYQGHSLYAMGKGADSWAFALVDRRVIFSNRVSAVKGVVDALTGKADPQEQLTANPRYSKWMGSGSGKIVRAFVDAVEVNKLIEKFLPAIDHPETAKSIMAWTGWANAEYIDLAFDETSLDVSVNFTQAPVWSVAIPPAGEMSMLKYLPAYTMFCVAGHTGELDKAVNGVVEFLDKAETINREFMKDAKNERDRGRNMLGERSQSARAIIDDFLRNIAFIAYQRAALRLADTGRKDAFSGTVEELSKLVSEPSLNTSMLGYKPDRITGLKVKDSGGYEGLISYKSAAGREAMLSLNGTHASCETSEAPGSPKRADANDGLPPAEIVNGAIDAITVAAGMSRKEAAEMMGKNGVFGFAANPLELKLGKRPFDDDTSWFVAFEVRKMDSLLTKVASTLAIVPQARHLIDPAANGAYTLAPSYQKDNVKVLALTEEACIAFTHDAVLVGAPGILIQMLDNKRRPDSIMSAMAGMGGCAMMAWDMENLFPANIDKDVAYYRHERHMGMGLPLAIMGGKAGSASLNYGSNTLNVSFRHGMKNIGSNPLFDVLMRAGWGGMDEWMLQEYYEQAQRMYSERLKDDKKDNDKFPTIAEVKAANKNNKDEDDRHFRGPGGGDENSSSFPGKKLEDAWMFVPPVGKDGQNPLGIIALSLDTVDGRFLAASRSEILSISIEFYEKLSTALADPKTLDANAFDISNIAKLTDMEAALWLETHWLSEIGQELRQKIKGKLPAAGETFFLERIGNVRVNSADENAVEIMVSGYGHTATILGDVGIIGASWRSDLSRNKPRKEPNSNSNGVPEPEGTRDAPLPKSFK